MDFSHKLGKRIKELRKKAQLSQDQLAERSGTSGKYLGQIERGEVNVSAIILVKIANVLQVNMMQIFEFEHIQDVKNLKNEMIELINNANDAELIRLYKVINSVLF